MVERVTNDMPVEEKPALSDAELRRYIDERFAAIDERFDAGGTRMETIETKLNANTALTQRVHDILSAVEGGFKVLGWLGNAAALIAKLMAPIATAWAIYQSAKHGAPPQPPHSPK